MMGYDFLVEEELKYAPGVMGGNLWLFCNSVNSGIKVGREVVKIISEVENVCTTFDVCSAGSYCGTRPPWHGCQKDDLEMSPGCSLDSCFDAADFYEGSVQWREWRGLPAFG